MSELANFYYFNSIKVRLRRYGWLGDLVIQQFQFHKGSIKTCNAFAFWRANTLFQFHKGSIKTVN